MQDVFIVSTEEEQFNLFYGNFRHLPIHFSWAKDLDSAIKYLELENPAFVFLISDDIDLLLNWVEKYNHLKIKIPFLCFTGYTHTKQSKELWAAGAIDIIFLPMNIKELEYTLKTLVIAIEVDKTPGLDIVEGRLEDFNLVHLIQTFEEGKKSGILLMEDGIKKGEVEFLNGQVVNAVYSNRDPLEAVTIMSAWKKGHFKAKQGKPTRRKRIALANQQVIMECLNYISIQEKLLNSLPTKNKMLFPSPLINFEELSPRDRNQLLSFKDGNTLEGVMEMFTGNLNQLLRKMDKWSEKKWLVEKTEYNAILKKMDAEENKSSFKRMLEKMFEKAKPSNDAGNFEAKYSYLEKTDVVQTVTKKSSQFKNYKRVGEFLNLVEEAE
ncbi:MAG: DUF4388 domain-containing protein [Calditrichaceae bacterium]|jgi:hypothetical protein